MSTDPAANYYVIASDGQKYGPADILVLNQWAQEGRITASATLEHALTGQRFLASSIPGIVFPSVGYTGPSAPGGYTSYPRTSAQGGSSTAWLDRQYLSNSMFVLVLLSVCCSTLSLVFALVTFLSTQDPEVKNRAKICLIVSGSLTAIGIMFQVFGAVLRSL